MVNLKHSKKQPWFTHSSNLAHYRSLMRNGKELNAVLFAEERIGYLMPACLYCTLLDLANLPSCGTHRPCTRFLHTILNWFWVINPSRKCSLGIVFVFLPFVHRPFSYCHTSLVFAFNVDFYSGRKGKGVLLNSTSEDYKILALISVESTSSLKFICLRLQCYAGDSVTFWRSFVVS